MRILVLGPPPDAHSGYGTQCGMTAEQLAAQGHDVAILAYASVAPDHEWNGITVLSSGGKPYGNGVIAGSYARWKAELLITVCDPWTIEPGQLRGLAVMPWMPVDCEPLSRMEQGWLAQVPDVRPVAMSAHGAAMLAEAGWQAPVVPHAIRPGFVPDAAAGSAWRASAGLPAGSFLIAKIGVNNEDDRKSFVPTLVAFAGFAQRHKDACLYLHTEAQVAKAPNLALAAIDLGLKGRIAFADQDRRAADLYPAGEMAAISNAADVADVTSRAEGFCVPLIEFLACGTPVIGCRNSAVREKIRPAWGWLVNGQRERPRHHQAWWSVPLAADLERCYVKAAGSARSMRAAAAREGARWTAAAMGEAWAKALAGL